MTKITNLGYAESDGSLGIPSCLGHQAFLKTKLTDKDFFGVVVMGEYPLFTLKCKL